MNAKAIGELYNQIIRMNAGAHVVNIDLHIHTPASKDFKFPKGVTEKEAYFALLDEALAHKIEIIAITDHNTFDGYNKLKKYIDEDKANRKKYNNILILCGIEITCYSNHLLAIFNSDFLEDRQNQFLHDIGIEKEARGTEEAMADELSPSGILRKIDEYKGISILAHADAEKGFLYSFFLKKKQEIVFKGKALSKIIKSPYLYGIQLCSAHSEKRIKEIFSNKDYLRKDRQLPFLYFSDAHGITVDGSYTGTSGKRIGSVLSRAKLSYKSFNALKMVLSDMDTRIVSSSDMRNYPIIIGCAIKSDVIRCANNEYALFHFSDQLNCVIGARGTGKSTLLGIIHDVLEYEIGGGSPFSDRYQIAAVFIRIEENVYAICNDNAGRTYRSLYKKEASKSSFKSMKGEHNFLNLFLTKTYRQGELIEYQKNPSKILDNIDDFIMWRHYSEYGSFVRIINQTTDEIGLIFKQCINHEKELLPFMKDQGINNIYFKKYNDILMAKDNIANLRELFVMEINKILNSKLKLRVSFELKIEEYEYITSHFSRQVANKAGKYYDYEVKIREFLISIIEKSKVRAKLDFFALLITNQFDKIIEEYCLPQSNDTLEFMHNIRQAMGPAELMLYLENGICLEYNVNSGISKAKMIFRNSQKLSLGQNAVALLLIVLTASQGLDDNRPLLMDQPEDDLDNSYIFNTLVDEFRNSKCKRQLIISTHNANIPVAADAENIIVLKYNGEYGYMSDNGSLDNPAISESVLDILEGGELAMRSRNDKYQNIVKIVK